MPEQLKKILIIGYSFFPENRPRAFRTYELVRELVSRGFQVDLLLPAKQAFRDQPVKMENLKIRYLGETNDHAKAGSLKSFSKQTRLRNIARSVYRYFNPFTNTFKYISLIRKELQKDYSGYDMLISISYPVVCHIGTALALKRNKQLKAIPLKVAEYSDPFYTKRNAKMFFMYKYLDRWAASKFDYIVVPAEDEISAYKNHIAANKIRVIPQGFNFQEVVLDTYIHNDVPQFAYAGVFYSKLRNPKKLFEFLENMETPYVFHLYTSPANTDSMDVINQYAPRLGNKLKIYHDVNRLELIRHLSKMDFLININNNSFALRSPSKLIDYALSKRPVFHFDHNDFDEMKFRNYLNGIYDSDEFDISSYDIKNVVNQFLELTTSYRTAQD